MTVTHQNCSISKQHSGRSVYLRPRIAAIIAGHFPLSKDAEFEYRVEFDDEKETIIITKDI